MLTPTGKPSGREDIDPQRREGVGAASAASQPRYNRNIRWTAAIGAVAAALLGAAVIHPGFFEAEIAALHGACREMASGAVAMRWMLIIAGGLHTLAFAAMTAHLWRAQSLDRITQRAANLLAWPLAVSAVVLVMLISYSVECWGGYDVAVSVYITGLVFAAWALARVHALGQLLLLRGKASRVARNVSVSLRKQYGWAIVVIAPAAVVGGILYPLPISSDIKGWLFFGAIFVLASIVVLLPKKRGDSS